MGIFSTIGNFATKALDFISGNSSSISDVISGYQPTTPSQPARQPEPINTAKVEQQTQLQLADKENQRIELMKTAKLEIMTEEAELKIALEKARATGFEQMAGSIVKLQETLTNIAEKRLQIIELGSLEVIRQTEEFYQQMQADLTDKSEEFASTKLPQLLNTLQMYEVGSVPHNLFTKQIESLIINQNNLLTQQMVSLASRQQTVIDGIIASKNHIMTHTDQLTAQLVQQASGQEQISAPTPQPLEVTSNDALLVEENTQPELLPASS